MSSPQLLQSMCDTFDVKGIRHGRTISNVILVGVGAAAVEGGGADGGACGCGGGRSGADGGDRSRGGGGREVIRTRSVAQTRLTSSGLVTSKMSRRFLFFRLHSNEGLSKTREKVGPC